MFVLRPALAGILSMLLSISAGARMIDPDCLSAGDLLWSVTEVRRPVADVGTRQVRKPAFVHYELLPICGHGPFGAAGGALRAIIRDGPPTSDANDRRHLSPCGDCRGPEGS